VKIKISLRFYSVHSLAYISIDPTLMLLEVVYFLTGVFVSKMFNTGLTWTRCRYAANTVVFDSVTIRCLQRKRRFVPVTVPNRARVVRLYGNTALT